jgi:hypothetical protein
MLLPWCNLSPNHIEDASLLVQHKDASLLMQPSIKPDQKCFSLGANFHQTRSKIFFSWCNLLPNQIEDASLLVQPKDASLLM